MDITITLTENQIEYIQRYMTDKQSIQDYIFDLLFPLTTSKVEILEEIYEFFGWTIEYNDIEYISNLSNINDIAKFLLNNKYCIERSICLDCGEEEERTISVNCHFCGSDSLNFYTLQEIIDEVEFILSLRKNQNDGNKYYE